MSQSADRLDELIREALGEADQRLLDQFSGQSMPELLTDVFRGRRRRAAIVGIFANLAFFVAGIVGGVRFVQADDLRAMMLWGAMTILCFGLVISIKIWYWLEMNRLSITREVKRVELHVVQLAQKLADHTAE